MISQFKKAVSYVQEGINIATWYKVKKFFLLSYILLLVLKALISRFDSLWFL